MQLTFSILMKEKVGDFCKEGRSILPCTFLSLLQSYKSDKLITVYSFWSSAYYILNHKIILVIIFPAGFTKIL